MEIPNREISPTERNIFYQHANLVNPDSDNRSEITA